MNTTYMRRMSATEQKDVIRRAVVNLLHQIAGERDQVEPDCTFVPLDDDEFPTIQVYLLVNTGEHDLVEVTPNGCTYVCSYQS